MSVLVEGDEAGVVHPGTDGAVLVVVGDAIGSYVGAVVAVLAAVLVGVSDAVGPYVGALLAVPVDGAERACSDHLRSLLRHHRTDQRHRCHHQQQRSHRQLQSPVVLF